jgi:hypothetical protein
MSLRKIVSESIQDFKNMVVLRFAGNEELENAQKDYLLSKLQLEWSRFQFLQQQIDDERGTEYTPDPIYKQALFSQSDDSQDRG